MTRCKFCLTLTIETLRRHCSSYMHHKSLADLKACAEFKVCNICQIFWTCITQTCTKESVDHYLLDRPSDPEHLRDTTIYLSTFLHDMTTRTNQSHPRYAEGSQILVSAGPVEISRVFGTISIFAKPGELHPRKLVRGKYGVENNILWMLCVSLSSFPSKTPSPPSILPRGIRLLSRIQNIAYQCPIIGLPIARNLTQGAVA